MEAQTVKDYTDLLIAVRQSMNEYLLTGDLHGVACAAGTLTSRINNLKVIVAAYEDRTPNEKDRFEMSSLASTLNADMNIASAFRWKISPLATDSQFLLMT